MCALVSHVKSTARSPFSAHGDYGAFELACRNGFRQAARDGRGTGCLIQDLEIKGLLPGEGRPGGSRRAKAAMKPPESAAV